MVSGVEKWGWRYGNGLGCGKGCKGNDLLKTLLKSVGGSGIRSGFCWGLEAVQNSVENFFAERSWVWRGILD